MIRKTLLSLQGICKRFGSKQVLPPLDLSIEEGEFLTLLGPSGCGKTTVLRIIAGLEQADAGVVLLDGKDISALSPNLRPVNTVFQSYALFPHMTVFDNIAYGLRMEKLPREEVAQRVSAMLALVELGDFARRMPAQLSGGQQQRVALARALVKKPRVLLLDEPLSALDFKLRKQMQNELKRIQRELGITFIFVTHDQEEALSMSDRIVVMREGGIRQVGTPRQVYEEPNSLFVARFLGEINVFEASIVGAAANGKLRLAIGDYQFEHVLRNGDAALTGKALVLLRPEDMRLSPPDAANGLPGTVIERNYRGVMLDSLVRLASGQVVIASEFFDEEDPDFDYRLGEAVCVSWVPNWERLLPDDALA